MPIFVASCEHHSVASVTRFYRAFRKWAASGGQILCCSRMLAFEADCNPADAATSSRSSASFALLRELAGMAAADWSYQNASE